MVHRILAPWHPPQPQHVGTRWRRHVHTAAQPNGGHVCEGRWRRRTSKDGAPTKYTHPCAVHNGHHRKGCPTERAVRLCAHCLRGWRARAGFARVIGHMARCLPRVSGNNELLPGRTGRAWASYMSRIYGLLRWPLWPTLLSRTQVHMSTRAPQMVNKANKDLSPEPQPRNSQRTAPRAPSVGLTHSTTRGRGR